MDDMDFRNLVEIWSGPLALCGFRLFKSFSTPLTVTVISGAERYGEWSKSGVLVTSSVVNTEENCVLSISAFSDGVECSVPSARSGETPDPSDFCDFTKVYSFLLVLSSLIMLFMIPSRNYLIHEHSGKYQTLSCSNEIICTSCSYEMLSQSSEMHVCLRNVHLVTLKSEDFISKISYGMYILFS